MSEHRTKPDGTEAYPVGMVYVGRWTRNIYRVRDTEGREPRAKLIYRHPTWWLDGQGKHRLGNPFDKRPAMWRVFSGAGAMEARWELRR